MLAAMGYQPGKGLGKSAEGRATPLNVNLKAGRTGLGVDEAKRRRAAAAQQERQERGESDSSCLPSSMSCLHAVSGHRRDTLVRAVPLLSRRTLTQRPSGTGGTRTCALASCTAARRPLRSAGPRSSS